MTLEIELLDVYLGWDAVALPDDLTLVVRGDDQTIRVNGALLELLVAYGRLQHETDGTTILGSGSGIEIEFEEDHVRFAVPPVEVREDAATLQAALASPIGEAFREKDRRDPERRSEQLAYLEKRLSEKGLGLDVTALYCDLVGEDDESE